MKIRIKNAQVTDRNVTRARDNKAFRFREQQGFVAMGEEVRAISVSLEGDQAAYPPGEYELLDGSFYVDRNGRLQLGRLALKPLVAAAQPTAQRVG